MLLQAQAAEVAAPKAEDFHLSTLLSFQFAHIYRLSRAGWQEPKIPRPAAFDGIWAASTLCTVALEVTRRGSSQELRTTTCLACQKLSRSESLLLTRPSRQPGATLRPETLGCAPMPSFFHG